MRGRHVSRALGAVLSWESRFEPVRAHAAVGRGREVGGRARCDLELAPSADFPFRHVAGLRIREHVRHGFVVDDDLWTVLEGAAFETHPVRHDEQRHLHVQCVGALRWLWPSGQVAVFRAVPARGDDQ